MTLRTYKLGLIGSKDLTVEQAQDARAACWKAGWDPDKCQVQDITDELAEAERKETYIMYDLCTSPERFREVERMFARMVTDVTTK